MAETNRDLINSAMGGSQDPTFDDAQFAMGAVQELAIPPLALTFSDGTPLQFSNGAYLETAA